MFNKCNGSKVIQVVDTYISKLRGLFSHSVYVLQEGNMHYCTKRGKTTCCFENEECASKNTPDDYFSAVHDCKSPKHTKYLNSQGQCVTDFFRKMKLLSGQCVGTHGQKGIIQERNYSKWQGHWEVTETSSWELEGALEMFTSVRWGENYIAALRKEIRIQKVDVQTFDMNQNMSLYIYITKL